MTACLPFSKIRFLTVNPRTGYILLGFIMLIIIYFYQDFYYLNDIAADLSHHRAYRSVHGGSINLTGDTSFSVIV